MLEDKWGGVRVNREDTEKEKKIKTARTVFTMTNLDFVLDEINPLGFLNLDVEGWEAYIQSGAGEALRGVKDTFFVVCKVWDDRDRKRRYISLRDANGSRPPCDDVLATIAEHPNFEQNR